MNVLIACETSGKVRRAFQAKGHNVFSCDVEPADDGEKHTHITMDVIEVLMKARLTGKVGIDLMIAFPPCTYLCNSGIKHLVQTNAKGKKEFNLHRMSNMWKALALFNFLRNFHEIPMIAIENPIPHKYGVGKTYDQIIQPWEHGHKETKATCLWLKGLPKLKPSDIVGPPPKDKNARKSWNRRAGQPRPFHNMPPSKDRGKLRFVTYDGIAKAMAEQWS